MTQWGPVVDGVLLPDSPIKLLAQGRMPSGAKVPVLMGSNADEGTTFLQASVHSNSALADWANTTCKIRATHLIFFRSTFSCDSPQSAHRERLAMCAVGPTIGTAVNAFYGNQANWDWPAPTPEQPELASEAWNQVKDPRSAPSPSIRFGSVRFAATHCSIVGLFVGSAGGDRRFRDVVPGPVGGECAGGAGPRCLLV